MSFFVFCFALALVFQFLAIHLIPRKSLRCLPFFVMELFPAAMIAYYAIVRPNGFFFDWKDNIIFALYIAAAILLGCLCAAVLHLWKKR